ncbi:Multiple antibiotic resistance protein MarR [Burkholderiaceae bacterium]|nr:Multiple antibiotic resistance protein MarR [Burkholderiaceae bacterium]
MTPPRATSPEDGLDQRLTRGGLDQSRLTHLVGYAASRASIELKKTFQTHLGPLDLKAVEFSILVLVASNQGVNQKQLCQSLDVSAPNMAITLDRMVERGWIERVRSTEDRRAQLIHLTPAGQALVRKAEKIAATMEQEAVGVLSEAERMLLIELLLKVARGRPAKRR